MGLHFGRLNAKQDSLNEMLLATILIRINEMYSIPTTFTYFRIPLKSLAHQLKPIESIG